MRAAGSLAVLIVLSGCSSFGKIAPQSVAPVTSEAFGDCARHVGPDSDGCHVWRDVTVRTTATVQSIRRVRESYIGIPGHGPDPQSGLYIVRLSIDAAEGQPARHLWANLELWPDRDSPELLMETGKKYVVGLKRWTWWGRYHVVARSEPLPG